MKNARKIIGSLFVLAVAVVGVGALQKTVLAATMTLRPGDDVQAAITAAKPGDTLTLAAGTYNVNLSIQKPLTVKGDGNVILTVADPNALRAIQIYNTSNVTLANLTIDGLNTPRQPWDKASIGVDINSASNVTLDKLTIKNFGRNAVSLVGKQDSEPITTSNVALNNVAITDGTTGVAMYSKSTSGTIADINGVTFGGKTTFANLTKGFQVNDPGDSPTGKVSGLNGGALDFGVVSMTNVTTPIVANNAAAMKISPNSVVNNVALAGLSQAELRRTLGLDANANITFNDGTGAADDKIVTPNQPLKPPATGRM